MTIGLSTLLLTDICMDLSRGLQADIIRPPSAPEDLTQVIISGSPSAGVYCYGLASPLFATVFSL